MSDSTPPLQVNLLGFGLMGKQVASLFTCLGARVTVWSRGINDEAMARYHRELRLIARMLKITPPETAVLRVAARPEELPPALTFEALLEDLEVKRSIISRLVYDPAPYGLLTNTSSLSPREIHPAAAGLHFFNPVHALRFAEFAAPPGTRTPGMEDLLRRLDGLGFALIEADFNRGYIGNYILFREIAAALQLIDRHHYTSRAIDEVLKRMGRPVSLFEIIDLVGVDVTLRIIQNLRGEDPSIHLSPLLQRAVSEGILGRKNQTSLRTLVDAPRP